MVEVDVSPSAHRDLGHAWPVLAVFKSVPWMTQIPPRMRPIVSGFASGQIAELTRMNVGWARFAGLSRSGHVAGNASGRVRYIMAVFVGLMMTAGKGLNVFSRGHGRDVLNSVERV